APRAGSTEEDDGYLITFVAEEATGASELQVLDAQRPADEPVCRLAVPQRVPTGYHTWWVDEATMATQRGL
ncbi:MAG: carotenoid oxygenase family protein, partial [Acidimicrobiales bacterium]